LFGRSIAAAMAGGEPPEDGYRGDYVRELAERIRGEGLDASDTDAISRRGIELMVDAGRHTLERFRVRFDNWSSEGQVHAAGHVEEALAQLEDAGHVYSSEGATWMRTTRLGDEKDRVLRRSSGELTYFASDIAYHVHKRERGFDRLVNILGADHDGYVAR